MRRCQRIGCENSLAGLRADAKYCCTTCRREAARSRAFSGPESWGGFDWLRYARIRRKPSPGRAHKALAMSVALFAFLVAGCGGGSHKTPTPTPPPAALKTVRVCSGLTDRCHTENLPANGGRFQLTAPRASGPGCRIVDVSDYQGVIHWPTTKPVICAAVVKMGEASSYAAGGRDFDANWSGLRAAGIPHTGYWFLRPYATCQTEAGLIIAKLEQIGYAHDPLALPFQLDGEVPGIGSQLLCIDARVFAAIHRHVGDYTAPGTYDGGAHTGLTLWQAEYGPTLHAIWQPVVAWQCTDGIFGCKTFVPGIGYDDVSLNYGLAAELPGKPKPAGPSIKQIQAWIHARNNALSFYHENKCVKPILAGSGHGFYCEHFAAQVVSYQEKLPGKHPVCWGAHRTPAVPVCQIVRPEYSIQLAAERTSYSVARARGCYGPSGQTPIRSRVCDPLFGRARYFTKRAAQTHEAWS